MVCVHNNLQQNWINIIYAQKQLKNQQKHLKIERKKKLSNLETNFVPDFSFQAIKQLFHYP